MIEKDVAAHHRRDEFVREVVQPHQENCPVCQSVIEDLTSSVREFGQVANSDGQALAAFFEVQELGALEVTT